MEYLSRLILVAIIMSSVGLRLIALNCRVRFPLCRFSWITRSHLKASRSSRISGASLEEPSRSCLFHGYCRRPCVARRSPLLKELRFRINRKVILDMNSTR